MSQLFPRQPLNRSSGKSLSKDSSGDCTIKTGVNVMSVLLRTAVLRSPEPHPSSRLRANAIFTHPEFLPAEVLAVFAGSPVAQPPFLPFNVELPELYLPTDQNWRTEFSVRLFESWQQNDWHQIRENAEAYLAVHNSDADGELHEMTKVAIKHFDPRSYRIRDADITAYFSAQKRGASKKYFSGPYWKDMARLSNVALARQVIGTLGSSHVDVIVSIRAMSAHLMAVAQKERKRPKRETYDGAAVRKVLSYNVFLPWWSFQMTFCPEEESTPIAESSSDTKSKKMKGVLPGDDDCGCVDNEFKDRPCEEADSCCAEIRYFIADLLELRERTHCYKAGDLAYIENIAAGETRTRKHESNSTKETFFEKEVSDRSTQLKDHQVSDRSSLQHAIDAQVEQSLNASASASASYGSEPYKINIAGSLSYEKSSSQAIKEAQENVRELISKATTEIEKETRSLRSERVTTEEKEKNIHSFVNIGKPLQVTKYFYVTQEKRAQLFNHGKRLMTEVLIPQPARLYEQLNELKIDQMVAEKFPAFSDFSIDAPTEPGITTADIKVETYKEKAASNGVTNPPEPPSLQSSKETALQTDSSTRRGKKTFPAVMLQIPPDHVGHFMKLSGTLTYRKTGSPRKVAAYLAGEKVQVEKDDPNPGWEDTSLPNIEGDHEVIFEAQHTKNFSVKLDVSLSLKPAVLESWKQDVVDLIDQNYEADLIEYEEKKAQYRQEELSYLGEREAYRLELLESRQKRHPFYNREIEQAELKRSVIQLLCEQSSEESAIFKSKPCGYPELDRKTAQKLTDEWYFWDRCFDWKHMAYVFFDYFWNPCCDWPEKYDPDEEDPLFKAFLRAGYARVLIPVSPDMDSDFLYYAHGNGKWGHQGRPPIDPSDARWRNVVYELQHVNESALTARTGYVYDVKKSDNVITVKETDIYWDAVSGIKDQQAIDSDIDRELLIDGDWYLVTDIRLHPGSPAFDSGNLNQMWWEITLNKPYHGEDSIRALFSMGAKAVAPAFKFEMPTDLIWAGYEGDCLPCFPLSPCTDSVTKNQGEDREPIDGEA